MTARPFDNVCMTQPLAGGPERAVNRKDIMPATAPFVVDAAGQQSPSPRPDVRDSESESDDELCILPLQTLAPVAVAVPVVSPVVQRPPVPLPRRSRRLAEKNIIQRKVTRRSTVSFEISCFVVMCVMISFYTEFMIFMSDATVLGSWYVFILVIFKL